MPDRTDIRDLIVRQWTPGYRTTWNFSGIRSALSDHAVGQMSLPGLLAESMLDDDELAGALDRRCNAVVSSPFSLTEEAGRALPDLGRWQDSVPEGEVAELLRWYHLTGIAVGTIDWDDEWRPHVRALHPQYLWRDSDGQWRFAGDGETYTVTPGDGKWILLTHGIEQGWRRAAMRRLAVTWLSKQYAIRDWNRYNERHGLPTVLARVPSAADETDTADFVSAVRSINSEGVAVLPQLDADLRFDLDLLEAKDGSWESFERLIERCDRKFAVNLTGSHLGSEQVDNGSRAAAETHRGVAAEQAQADAEYLGTELRRQLVMPWMTVLGLPPEDAPWPTYDTSPAEDAAETAAGAKALGDALQSIQTAGYDVANIDELAAKFGLELVEREEPEPEPEPDMPEDGGDDDEGEAGEELAAHVHLAATLEAPVDAYDGGMAYSLAVEEAAAKQIGEELSRYRARQLRATTVEEAVAAYADEDTSGLEETLLGLLLLQRLAGIRSARLGPGASWPAGTNPRDWSTLADELGDVLEPGDMRQLLSDARFRARRLAAYAAANGAGDVVTAIANGTAGDLVDALSGQPYARPAATSWFNRGRLSAMAPGDAWQYDAVLDDRTTDLCRSLNGLVMPAQDPRWYSRMPPLHSGCRSSIRAVGADALRSAEYTSPPFESQALPGWGAYEDFEPSLDRYPPELRGAILERIAA